VRLDGSLDSARDRRRRFAFRPFVTIGWLLVVATAFALGYLLAGYDVERTLARIQALQTERDTFSEALAAERDMRVRMERSHLIDREAQRAVQSQLADLQGERLRLAKQVAYLRGLLHVDGKGIVEVKEFVLTKRGEEGDFEYQFTVNQLIPDFEPSSGTAEVKLVVRDGEDDKILALTDLPGSTDGRHKMAFDHFQSFSGTIRLPADVEARQVIVDIRPANDNLLPSSEAFVWHASDVSGAALTPVVASEAGDL
jgi:hypothetical protein